MAFEQNDLGSQLGIFDAGLGDLEGIESILSDEEFNENPKPKPKTKAPAKEEPVKKEEDDEPQEVVIKTSAEEDVDASDINSLFEDEPEKVQDEDQEDTSEESEPEQEETVEEEEEADSDNVYEKLSNDLFELGFFTKADENEKAPTTPEELLAKFNSEKQRGVQDYIEQFLTKEGDDRKELFDAIFVKGVDPRNYLTVYSEMLNLAELDLSDEGAQEAVFRESYRRKGWTQDKIEKRLNKVRELGDLEDEAQFEYENLVEADKKLLEDQVAQKEADKKAKEEAARTFKTSITNILKEKAKAKTFDGIPVTDKVQKTTEKFLSEPAWKLPSGEYITDFDKFLYDLRRPENYEMLVKVALLAQNKFDLSKVKQSAVTKETNEVFKNLVSQKTKTKNKKVDKNDSLFSWNL